MLVEKVFYIILIFLLFTVRKAQQGTFDSWSIGVNAGLMAFGIRGPHRFYQFKVKGRHDILTSLNRMWRFEVDVE